MIGDKSKHSTREIRKIGKVINRPIEMYPHEKIDDDFDLSVIFKSNNFNDRELLVKQQEFIGTRPFGLLPVNIEYDENLILNFADSAYNKITLTGDLVIENILGLTNGSSYKLILIQDEIGDHNVSINMENISMYINDNRSLEDINTNANSITYLNITSLGDDIFVEMELDSFNDFEVINNNYFSFDINLTSDLNFTLPIQYGGDQYIHNFTVDWGDNTTSEINSFDSIDATHTYSTSGTYTIKINGTCEYFAFNNVGDRLKLTKLNRFFGDCGFKVLNFRGCTNLTGSIPTSFTNLHKLITCSNLFNGCTNLTGSIPENMFWNSKNIVRFDNTFRNTKVSGGIPEKLFWYNPNATIFFGVFAQTSQITGSIPEKLFWNNPNVTNLVITFALSGVSGSIPEKLFWYNPLVTTFQQTFSQCNGITGSIPEKLFWYNPLVTSFSSTFSRCNGITGSIPEKLFWYNPLVTSFSSLFNFSINISGFIPEKLFWNNPLVTSFSTTFSQCYKIESLIPEKLFWNNPLVTTFYFTFNRVGVNTNNFYDIPKNIFKYNQFANIFNSTFRIATRLTGDGWIDIINQINTHALKNNLTLDTTECFRDSTALTDYSSIPTAWR